MAANIELHLLARGPLPRWTRCHELSVDRNRMDTPEGRCTR